VSWLEQYLCVCSWVISNQITLNCLLLVMIAKWRWNGETKRRLNDFNDSCDDSLLLGLCSGRCCSRVVMTAWMIFLFLFVWRFCVWSRRKRNRSAFHWNPVVYVFDYHLEVMDSFTPFPSGSALLFVVVVVIKLHEKKKKKISNGHSSVWKERETGSESRTELSSWTGQGVALSLPDFV